MRKSSPRPSPSADNPKSAAAAASVERDSDPIKCEPAGRPDSDKTHGQALPDGNQPPNPEATAKATRDNKLSTGHSHPGDGGDNSIKRGS